MSVKTVAAVDRLALRGRPEGSPVMHQTWENLLFMHWPIDPTLLRPLIPQPLEIETFEGKAWIGITPFSLTHLHSIPGPEVPGLNSFLELNVRTYVHHNGVPGIWFFSLDASKIIPVLAARLFYSLPYVKASMEMKEENGAFIFSSRREGNFPAEFDAMWKPGIPLRMPALESLTFFLVERYCLYSADDSHLYRARVYHAPWSLRDAELLSFRSTLLTSHGLAEPTGAPLLHFSNKQNVEVWPRETVC